MLAEVGYPENANVSTSHGDASSMDYEDRSNLFRTSVGDVLIRLRYSCLSVEYLRAPINKNDSARTQARPSVTLTSRPSLDWGASTHLQNGGISLIHVVMATSSRQAISRPLTILSSHELAPDAASV